MQTQAQTEARDVVFAGVGRGGDLALDAPLAEPAGDDDAVEVPEAPLGQEALDLLGLDPFEVDLGPVGIPAMAQGLDHREVGVGQVDVLADQADAHRLGGGLDPVDRACQADRSRACPPVRPLPSGSRTRAGAHVVVEAFLVQGQRDLVEVGGVHARDDGLHRDVALSSEILRFRPRRWCGRCGR